MTYLIAVMIFKNGAFRNHKLIFNQHKKFEHNCCRCAIILWTLFLNSFFDKGKKRLLSTLFLPFGSKSYLLMPIATEKKIQRKLFYLFSRISWKKFADKSNYCSSDLRLLCPLFIDNS